MCGALCDLLTTLLHTLTLDLQYNSGGASGTQALAALKEAPLLHTLTLDLLQSPPVLQVLGPHDLLLNCTEDQESEYATIGSPSVLQVHCCIL